MVGKIHELNRTSHRIYSLYRILLTVSSPELGPGTSSPSSGEVARFSSRFLEGETSSLHWVKSRFCDRFGISLMQMTRNSPCLDRVSMLLLASGMVKMPSFLTPYSQNSPWERTLKMTCFIARFADIKPIAFLPFPLPSPSPLLIHPSYNPFLVIIFINRNSFRGIFFTPSL